LRYTISLKVTPAPSAMPRISSTSSGENFSRKPRFFMQKVSSRSLSTLMNPLFIWWTEVTDSTNSTIRSFRA